MKARDILFPLEMYDVDFVLQRICHRRVLVSLLIVVLASFTVACGSSEVATVSTEDEAIEILTVLYDNGIDAYKKEEGDDTGRRWKIFVEEKLLVLQRDFSHLGFLRRALFFFSVRLR